VELPRSQTVNEASERVDRQRVGAENLGRGVMAKRRSQRALLSSRGPPGSDVAGWSAVVMSLVFWALRRVLELVLLVLGPLLILGPLGMLPGEEVMP
jgi:hypothetical protein